MLVKHIQRRLTLLRPALYFTTTNQLHQSNEPDQTEPSKHNPHAFKDLRGHNNIEQMGEADKAFSPLHSTTYTRASAYHLSSLLNDTTARLIGSLVESPRTALASDCLHLPRIHPGAVPVYDSVDSVNSLLVLNKALARLSPLVILAISPAPTLALGFYLLGLYSYHQFVWKWSQHLVVKTELLPHTEELAYQKISAWGTLTTRKVKIADLELTRMEELTPDTDFSERGTRGLLNKEVAFKVRGSSELLLFERNGVWHQEGVNHPLLV